MVRPIGRGIDAACRNALCKIGQHEAGHHMTARRLGFKTGEITLTVTDDRGGHEAGAVILPASSLYGVENILSYLNNRVIVLYAGALAESLERGRPNIDHARACLNEKGGEVDNAKARELIHLIRNIKHPDTQSEEDVQCELDLIADKLWQKTTELVVEDHYIIVAIGQKLAAGIDKSGQKSTLSEDELEKLVEKGRLFRKQVGALPVK